MWNMCMILHLAQRRNKLWCKMPWSKWLCEMGARFQLLAVMDLRTFWTVIPNLRKKIFLDIINETVTLLQDRTVSTKPICKSKATASDIAYCSKQSYRCILVHILATVSRHVTEYYANSPLQAAVRQNVDEVWHCIKCLQTLISELRWILYLNFLGRRITPLRRTLRQFLVVPVATRWLSMLTMVKTFAKAGTQEVTALVAQHAPLFGEEVL